MPEKPKPPKPVREWIAGHEYFYECPCGFTDYLDSDCKCESCSKYATLPLTHCPDCGERFVVPCEDGPDDD